MKAAEYPGCGAAEVLQPPVADQVTAKDGRGTAAVGGPTRFRTVCAFLKSGACSRTLMTVLDQEFGQPLKLEEQATNPLAGGMMQGYQCGMLWGSTLAAGALAHRLHGAGPRAEGAALRAAQRLVEAFRERHEHIDCLEITETDPQNNWQLFVHFFLKGGTIRCAAKMANFAPDAFRAINTALAEEEPRVCNPASCAAVLARRMGASELHAVMAAGFAGGIGLSGSGCGALGAAIWILGMNLRREGLTGKVIEARINELMERFLVCSDHEYSCAAIVGRRFADGDDHASYLQRGGCADLIAAIAAAATAVQEQVPLPVTEEAVRSGGSAAAGQGPC